MAVHRTCIFLGEVGGLGGLADASAFGLEGASCCWAIPAGLCNALYASIAVGSARIFAMRSALVAFGGRETEAVLRTSLRSATLRAFLTRRALEDTKRGFCPKTHNLDSIVDLGLKDGA